MAFDKMGELIAFRTAFADSLRQIIRASCTARPSRPFRTIVPSIERRTFSRLLLPGLAVVFILASPFTIQTQAQEPPSGDTGTVGTETFSIPNLGGWTTTSNGTETTTQEGYGRIRADAGKTTPSGIAIIGYRPGGTLVAEAGVPASEPVREGRIFAEVNGPVNTGLAIANPNDAPATIDFYFTDTDGARFAEGAYVLDAGRQIADFLNETPFNGGDEVLGTFTFTSSLPIAVIALRGFTNRDGEFLMTTLPVAPLAAPLSPFSVDTAYTDTVYFPHFADGNGWATQVILVNPTVRTITGTVEFLGQGSSETAASPAILTLDDGRTGSSFDYSIPPRSSRRLTTSNPSGSVSVGSVRAIPDSGRRAPSGLVVFSYTPGGKTVSEAGVSALTAGSAFRVYVESSGTPEQAGSIRTGLAIVNTADTSTTVTLEVTGLDGTPGPPPATLSLPPSGQVARFLDEFFDSLPDHFSGVLRVSSTADVAIVGLRLRINDKDEIRMTTTPPSDETGASTTAESFFPHIVDSAGWSTQFILFSGTAGQASSGTLIFIDTEGEPLDLSVAPMTRIDCPSSTGDGVTVHTATGFEQDADEARYWIEWAEKTLALGRYRFRCPPRPVHVFLEYDANEARAWAAGGYGGYPGAWYGNGTLSPHEIHLQTPSAYRHIEYGFVRTIVHEYLHHIQTAITGGLSGMPSWFIEGQATYDSFRFTMDRYRQNNPMEYWRRNWGRQMTCKVDNRRLTLELPDGTYSGGSFVIHALAETYGSDFDVDVLYAMLGGNSFDQALNDTVVEYGGSLQATCDTLLELASSDGDGTTPPGQGQNPVVTGVVFNNSPQSGDTYRVGEDISIGIRFSEPVIMTGSPQLALTIGSNTRYATTHRDTTPRDFRSFRYTVQSEDRDDDGISITRGALLLNGGTIKSSDGEDAALDLGVQAVNNDASRKVAGNDDNGMPPPGQGQNPVVTGVVFNNSPQSGDTYRVGEDISIGIRFSEPVIITGSPQLALTIGSNTRYATTYRDTTPRDFRSFRYTVQSEDRDDDGISITRGALLLNGGTIKSSDGEDAALDLGVQAVNNDASRKVAGNDDNGTGGNGGGSPSQLQGDGYTVHYDEGYRSDAEFVREVLDEAAVRFQTRYGPNNTRVDIHLLSAPTTVNGVMIQPGRALASGGRSQLEIYLMSRSAPVMQGACCNGIGLHFTDVGYQRTVLVHEYSTAFQHHYAGYNKWSGWFVQGLQQYEGLAAAGSRDLWQRAAERVFRGGTVSCGRGIDGNEQLTVTEVYWAGALVLRYLADRFGEASHIRILNSARSTLTEAIADEQPPGETPCELFNDYRNWMYETYGLGEPVR